MKTSAIGAVLCVIAVMTVSVAKAAAPVEPLIITLQDSSTDASIAHMRIVLDRDTVKSGTVTLQAENQSKTLVHEVLIVRDDGIKDLPFDAKHGQVIESRLRRMGEIADLAPGRSGKLKLNLKPGTYLLFCNQPGHYRDGMFTRLVVAP